MRSEDETNGNSEFLIVAHSAYVKTRISDGSKGHGDMIINWQLPTDGTSNGSRRIHYTGRMSWASLS